METFSPVNSPHKGQWRGALMFTLICARINGWVNNREAGDLRRYRGHYDVTVMVKVSRKLHGLLSLRPRDASWTKQHTLGYFRKTWNIWGLHRVNLCNYHLTLVIYGGHVHTIVFCVVLRYSASIQTIEFKTSWHARVQSLSFLGLIWTIG